MKNFIASILIVVLWTTVAQADWANKFTNRFEKKGLDVAVEKAVKKGVSPQLIMTHALSIPGVNPQNCILALSAAGISDDEILEAAVQNNISDLLVSNALQIGADNQVADIQAYTAAGRAGGRFGGNGGRFGRGNGGKNRGQTGRPFASPSGF